MPNETNNYEETTSQTRGTIIGEGNNKYRDCGLLFDERNNYYTFDKDDNNYFLSPGTPVRFDKDKRNECKAINVEPLMKQGILYDGQESHPLIQVYNNIAKVLLADVYNQEKGVTPETNTEILKLVLEKLESTSIDDFILKKWYDKAKDDVLND